MNASAVAVPADPRWVEGFTLGIETSGRMTGAALVRDGRLLAERAADTRASSQELLLDQVAGILHGHALRPRDLGRIGVSLGPGSFTGVRVGLAAARALAWGAGVGLVGVPTHQALAYPFRDAGSDLFLLTGMRRGQVCLEIGRWDGDRWHELEPARSVTVDAVGDIASRYREAGGGRSGLLFLGEAVESIQALDPAPFQSGRVLSDPLASARRPAPVAFLAARQGERAEPPEGSGGLEPIYLREADAVRARAARR